MKKILFLFDKEGVNSFSNKFRKDYEDLYGYLLANGIESFRAPIIFYNKNKKLFNKAYFLKGKSNWDLKKNLKPDLIFDKTPFFLEKKLAYLRKILAKNFCFVNDLNFSSLLSNKWSNYRRFQEFYPKTILIKSPLDFFQIKQLKSKYLILKPLFGSSGKGIKIQEKLKFKPLKTPFVVQELIDSSQGIRGLASGPHDLRIVMKDQTPFYSYLRIPSKGNLLANLARGGKLRVVPLKKIPAKALFIARKVSQKLKSYKHKFYSIDFVLDSTGKPWIIEMNSRPGLILNKEEIKYRNYFYDNLIDFINKVS
jgi:glutathione synthase/RimK-type ligase-like ATP-grasp enzyme